MIPTSNNRQIFGNTQPDCKCSLHRSNGQLIVETEDAIHPRANLEEARSRLESMVDITGTWIVAQARLGLLCGERGVQAARAAMQDADVPLQIGRPPYTDPFLVTTLLSIQLPLYPRLRIDWK
jgi:hypothetical protein